MLAMSRWKPNARSRLERAAIELYTQHGFQQTTVADIAERAGLSERTFFRHFADKREVLFSGGGALHERFVAALDDAGASLSAIDAVGAAVEAGATLLQDRRPFARQRQAIISANPELQERERIKLASLASALAEGLRRRGVTDPAASLAAEMGIAVFRIAFERWIGETDGRDLSQIVRESLNELKVVSAGT
jgi:AcrR family transcriptional regulator